MTDLGSNTRYAWRNGQRQRVDAAIVGAIIEDVIQRDGDCNPLALLNEARQKESPIHSLFEWSDGIAAERYRINQARGVIRALDVVIIEGVDGEERQLAFISLERKCDPDREDEESACSYVVMAEAVKDVDQRSIIVGREFARITGLIERCDWIEEFEPFRTAAVQVRQWLNH